MCECHTRIFFLLVKFVFPFNSVNILIHFFRYAEHIFEVYHVNFTIRIRTDPLSEIPETTHTLIFMHSMFLNRKRKIY